MTTLPAQDAKRAGLRSDDQPGSPAQEANQAFAGELQNLYGVNRKVEADEELNDQGLARLKDIPDRGLQSLSLRNCGAITNAGLKSICHLRSLQVLDLARTSISDPGMDSVAKLPELQVLNLSNSEITGKGISILPILL